MAINDAVKAVSIKLTVIENFLGYVKGEIITDAEKVIALIDSEYQNHFVKTAA